MNKSDKREKLRQVIPAAVNVPQFGIRHIDGCDDYSNIGMPTRPPHSLAFSASSNQHREYTITGIPIRIAKPATARATKVISVIKYWIKPDETACERSEKAVVATLVTLLLTDGFGRL